MAGILEGVASGKEVGFAEAGGNPPNSVSRRVSDPIGTHGGADGLLFNCPGGAEEFSPGFQPWETSNKAVRPERARDGAGEMPFECYRKGIGHFLGRRYNLPLANKAHWHKVERWRAP